MVGPPRIELAWLHAGYCDGMPPLRVVTFNIEEGGRERLQRITQLLRRQQADVIALCEANDRAAAEAIASELGMQLSYGEGNCPAALAWLSRLPVLHSRNHHLPQLAKTLLEMSVEWRGQPLRLFATHLADRRQEAGAYPRLGEMRAILEVLRQVRGPHVLVGDLNAVAPGDPVSETHTGKPRFGDALPDAPREVIGQLLNAGYVDCFRRLHPRARGYTYHTSRPWVRLDYIFASAAVARHLTECAVSPERASDHLAVRAAFVAS